VNAMAARANRGFMTTVPETAASGKRITAASIRPKKSLPAFFQGPV
jgi:hypothetical protein